MEATAERWAALVEQRAALRCQSPLRDDWLRRLGIQPDALDDVEEALSQIGGSAVEVAGQPRGLLSSSTRRAFLPLWKPWKDEEPEPPGARLTTYKPGRHALALTADECAEVVDRCASAPSTPGRGSDDDGAVYYPDLHGTTTAGKVWGAVRAAAAAWWPAPVSRVDVGVLRRDRGSRQPFHTDAFPGEGARRTVSLIVTLSRPDAYEGGEVMFQWADRPYVLPRPDAGHVVAFPATLVHGVDTVTAGTRWSLVAWAER